MAQKPNVSPGSVEIDLIGIQEGTHPLVLDGPDVTLSVDPSADRWVRGYRFEGTIARVERDWRVRGSLVGSLAIACDRCLAPFAMEFGTEVELQIVPSEPGNEGPVPEGVINVPPATSTVDLTEAFREAALLTIPMKNLCRADCRGICPSCGKNRNEEPCNCDPSPSDPRWEALRGLSFPSDPKE